MERTLKKLVVGLVVFGLVLLVANLLVDNPYTHRILRAAINEKAQQHTNLIVDFKALRVNVLPPGVDLYGVYVATSVEPDRPLVTASHAKARLSLWSLILGEARLSLIVGHDLAVVWPPPWNFPGFLKEDPEAPPEPDTPVTWPPVDKLPIDRVVISNARIFAELEVFDGVPHAGKWVTISAVGADLDATLDGLDDVDAELDVRSFDLAFGPGSLVENAAVKTDLTLRHGKFKTEGLEFKSERLELSGATLQGALVTHGREKLLDGLQIGVGGDIKGDLSALGSFLEFSDTRGRVEGKALVELTVPIGEQSALGDSIGFDVEGEAKIEDGWMEGFKLFDSAARFKVTPEAVSLPDIDIIIDGQSYGHAQGVLKLDDKLTFEFKGEPKLLRLEDLLDALGVSFRVFDTALDSPDLLVSGTGLPLHIDVKATTQATDIVLPDIVYDKSVYPLPPACRMDLRVAVTSTRVDFTGTGGSCYQPPETPTGLDPPKPGEIKPPPGSTAASKVALNGGIDLTGQAIDLSIDLPDVDPTVGQHFAQVALDGRGAGKAHVHGPFTKLLIDVSATVDELAAAQLPLGKLRGALTIKGSDVLLRESTLEPEGGGRFTLKSGTLNLNEELSFAFEAVAANVSPSFIGDIIKAKKPDLPLAFGFETMHAKLSGPIKHPLAWRGKVDLEIDELSYDKERILDRVQTTVVSDAQGFRAEKLTANKGPFKLGAKIVHQRAFPFSFAHAEASEDLWVKLGIHPDDVLAVDFASEADAEGDGDAPVDHLGQMPFVGALLAKGEIKSQLTLQGRLSGALDDLQGTLAGKLRRLSVFGAVLPDIELKGFVKKSRIDLMFTHLGNVLEGRLSLDVLEEGMPYDWYMAFNRLDVRAFGTRFFYADPRNFAYLTATWEMKGKLLDWWRSTGQLYIQDVRGKYVQDVSGQTRFISLKQESPVRLLFTPEGWRFEDDKDLYLEGKHISMRLSLPDCKPPERLSLKLEGIVDLGIARELSTLIDTATGKLKVVAEVIGPVSEPELVVEVTDLKPTPFTSANWQSVSLGITEARPALKNIQMRVFYAGGKLVIDSFTAGKGAGTITALGTLNLAQNLEDESRLDINLDNATLIVSVAFLKSFEMQLSGDLVLTGSSLPYRLAGDIEVVKARSTKEVDIRDEIINALRTRSITASVVKDKPVLELDLNITADRSINIHNRNVQSALSANLQVKGTDAQPSITGQVDIDKGKFIYKRDFVIERGIVSFDDPVKPDPTLDILAVSEVDNYRVYIAMTGRASQPVIEFAVDPPTRENGSPISKVEILVLLSRGSLPEENRSIGETQSAATSEAINLIMGQFEEPVEKLFDLSGQSVVRNVYIDTYPSSEGNPVPRLNLPLDLGEDFDVVLRTDQSTNEVSGEYNLHENINFSATWERRRAEEATQQSSQPTADTKLNLKFRFSFE
jgi:hypothetical protein